MKFLTLITMLFALKAAAANSLSLDAVPHEPVLITYGTTTILGRPVTAPYFIINSLKLNWQSDENRKLMIWAVTMRTASTNAPQIQIGCAVTGADLAASFASHEDHGKVLLAPGVTSSDPLPCWGFNLPTPVPASFDVPVEVRIYGTIIDENGDFLDRVTETQTIHLQ